MASEPQAVSAEERMIGLISKHQTVLHGYIFALIQDISRTDDILQETNLILWRKAAEYDACKPFLPWARSIAWYQVKAATRNLSRDRLVFSETTMQLLAEEAEEMDVYLPTQQEIALADCISILSPKQQELIKGRYLEGLGVNTLAARLRRSAASVSQALYVIRDNLKKCVRLKMTSATSLK